MTATPNKTDAGNGSKAVCRVSNVLRSPSPDPGRSANPASMDHISNELLQQDDDSTIRSNALEAFKVLLDFEKWCYDTYQKDFRFFLTLETAAAAITAKLYLDSAAPRFALLIAISLFGLFISLLWASRQYREFYFSRGRFEELRRLEEVIGGGLIGSGFRYFHEVQPRTRDMIAKQKGWIPLFGASFRILPNLYRRKAFLHSLVLQQTFVLLWIFVAVASAIELTHARHSEPSVQQVLAPVTTTHAPQLSLPPPAPQTSEPTPPKQPVVVPQPAPTTAPTEPKPDTPKP